MFELLQIERLVVSTYLIFLRHEFDKHTGSSLKGDFTLRYYRYLVLKEPDMTDAVTLENFNPFDLIAKSLNLHDAKTGTKEQDHRTARICDGNDCEEDTLDRRSQIAVIEHTYIVSV